MDSDDRKLINTISGVIEDLYGYERLMNWDHTIPIHRRIVHFTITSIGYAANEGYVMLLGMECDHVQLVLCLNELRLPDLAIHFDKMLSGIPKVGVLGNLDALERHFGSWEKFGDWVSPFQSQLYKNHDRIRSALAQYCKQHITVFAQLSPEVDKLLAAM